MRSWRFWKREIRKRLLLGPEDDGLGDVYGRRARFWSPIRGRPGGVSKTIARKPTKRRT
ncbi:MAG: hypothetical protein V1748_02785 [Actinomycetota bacterium]